MKDECPKTSLKVPHSGVDEWLTMVPDPPDTQGKAKLATVSRDARQALDVIIGYAEMLEDELSSDRPDLVCDVNRIREASAAVLELVSDLEEHAAESSRLANLDALTGLPNRRYFLHRARQLMRASRLQGRDVAVVMLDIDHFKPVNDSLGHAAGDVVLVEVGRRMRSALREPDLLARFGGEEFVVLIPNVSGVQLCSEIANRVREAVSASAIDTEAGSVRVTLSAGVAPGEGNALEELLGLADDALYEAKRTG